jgi:hypothetical protein
MNDTTKFFEDTPNSGQILFTISVDSLEKEFTMVLRSGPLFSS